MTNKMYHNKQKILKINKQSGATLAVGLTLLLIMTLIGITALKTTALEEKMAAGLHNKILAEGGAESALRQAEDFLWGYFADSNGLVLSAAVGQAHGFLDVDIDKAKIQAAKFRDMSTEEWLTIGKSHNTDFAATSLGAAKLNNNPRYYIQEIGGAIAGLAEFGSDGYEGSAGILKRYVVVARSDSGDGKIGELVESVFSTRTK